MNFNEKKATAVAGQFLFLAGGELEDLKLMKLMYLSEREMLRIANVSITGDNFVSMQNGPVLSATLDLMKGNQVSSRGETWNKYIAMPAQWKVKLRVLQAPDLDVLSIAEQTIIQEQWSKHGQKDKWKLVDLTHEFPEWDKRAKELQTSYPIPIENVLEALDLSKDVIKKRLAQMKAADYFEDLLEKAADDISELSN